MWFRKSFLAVGVMTGTSLGDADIVALQTDGQENIRFLHHYSLPYPAKLQTRLRKVVQGDAPLSDILRLEKDLSLFYATALQQAAAAWNLPWQKVDVVGVHGQTIRHLPAESLTWQLGDPSRITAALAALGFKGKLVMDFRRRDLANGGEGAPLAPLFHAALLPASLCPRPVAILNLGGLGNVTLLPLKGTLRGSDTGPGMGLLNELFLAKTGEETDLNGKATLQGKVKESILNTLIKQPFYQRPLPRSADRYEFAPLLTAVKSLPLANAAATLAAVTAHGVAHTVRELGSQPGILVWCGGGGRNKGVLKALENEGFKPQSIADFGIKEEWVEAGLMAWLAVRSLLGLPFTLPSTTGGKTPSSGGIQSQA